MTKENQYSDEQIRKMLSNYLTDKHGAEEANKIIQDSKYTFTEEFIPGNPVIAVKSNNEKYYRTFMINKGKLEELERVDENSEEGKILYNHK